MDCPPSGEGCSASQSKVADLSPGPPLAEEDESQGCRDPVDLSGDFRRHVTEGCGGRTGVLVSLDGVQWDVFSDCGE